jgi:hypothetical protein
MPSRRFGPPCLCGCGKRVLRASRATGQPIRYASRACVPPEVWRKGRQTFAFRKRAELFNDLLSRMGRKLSKEDLFTAFQHAYTKGYNAGYKAGLLKRQQAIRDVA